MIKLSIKKLEQITKYKVKKNFESLGLDIASTTGYATLKSDSKNILIECGFLQFDKSDAKQLWKDMFEGFNNLIKEQNIIVIEDTHHQFNAQVTIKLSRFGGIAMACALIKDIPYNLIGATSSRAKLGIKTEKGKAKESVAKWLKDNLNIELGIENNDASDAIVLGILGLLEGLDFRPASKIKK